ncbi:MAG TPA: SDR family NAD(P)-dependent oxidoreductase [Thermoanaerobaculia bacterium]|nr:SDR family NAD(P)-dependent oxidoreductase [Thermoanaerobaculia bacterium]
MKTIVITGASSGIGAALARHLGRQGHNLVLAARRAEALNAVAHEITSHVITVVTDVTRREHVNRLRDEALRAFGAIDVWINNVGRGISRPALDLTDAEFDEMMLVNVKSALYGMQAIVPHFVERRQGHIINISSFLGRVPIATHRSAYNAAKAALNALTANVRVDLAAKYPEVHVSLVMPGLVATEFAKNAIGSSGGVAPVWSTNSPTQSADEVAAAIAGVIERPVAEIYTNPASAAMARRYLEDVNAFEESLRPTPARA